MPTSRSHDRSCLSRATPHPRGHARRLTSTCLLLAFSLWFGAWRAEGALTLTAATNGLAISADTTGGSYTALAGPKLTESAKGQIGTGTIILNAPAGFVFNTGVTVTVTNTGNIILSNATATVTTNTIQIAVKTKSSSKSILTWTGIQVRPVAGTPRASGNITNSGTATGLPAKPTSYGTLTEVPGAATQLAFGIQPSSVSYGVVITPAITVKILDQYGNLKTNSSASVTMAVGNNPGGGTLSGTTNGAATNGTATFSTLSLDNIGNGYTLAASASGLTGVTSSAFNINPFRYVVASGSWTNTSIWSGSSGGSPGASVPVAGVSTFIGEAATAYTVTIPSGYGAGCGSATMGNVAGNKAAILNFTDSSSSLTVDGNVTMNRPNGGATTTIGLGAGSLTVNGTLELAHHTNSAVGNTLLNTITVSTGTLAIGGDLVFGAEQVLQSQIVFSGAGTLNLAGAFTLSNSLGTLTPSTSTVNFNGSTAGQTIPVGVSAVTYSNLMVNNTSASGATPSTTITGTQVTGNLSIQSGTFNNGGFAITLASAKNFSVSNAATFNLTGTSTMVTVSGGGTKTFGTSSTVNYAGANQTVTVETYGHLTLSGSGTKTMPGSTMTVAGNFTMADGSSASATSGAAINTTGDFTLGTNTTFNAGSFTNNVGGDWINNGATFTTGTSTINLNGTNGVQNIGGSADTLFKNLMINNSAGVTLGANPAVNGTLTLSTGILATASFQVNVTNTSNAAIVGASGSSYVNGMLQKNFATGSGQSFSFPIGGPSNYRPITLTNLNVTTAGALTAEVTGSAGEHPNISTSGLNASRDVNRYWTLTDDGVLVVGNYNPTFNFVASDADSGADTTQFVVRRFDGTNWSATTTGSRTSTNTAATGLNRFGTSGSDFVLGDPQASQMLVTLPGQSFTSGSGNSGTVSNQTAGTPFNVTLSAVDIFNFIDTSYTNTQTISCSGPANAPNGAAPVYATSVAFSSGQATGVATTLKKAETTAITAADTTNSITGVASSNLTVNVATAAKLAYTTVPGTGTAGTVFSVTVESQDANGNPASPTSNTTIALSKASGGGSLSGTLTGNILTSGNSVTIATPVYSKSDTLTLTASATAGMTSLTSVTSGGIAFSAGAANKLAYTTVPGSGTAGTAFSVTVQSQDANGNAANLASATTITLSKASGGGTMSGTLTGSIGSGANSITIATSVYSKSDTLTLAANASGGAALTTVTSGGITFSAGAANKLAFTTQPGNGTGGSALTTQPVVTVQDANGNTVTNDASTVTLAMGTNPGGGTLSGTLTRNAVAGVADFSTNSLKIDKAGTNYTLTATDGSLTSATSGTFNIAVGPPIANPVTYYRAKGAAIKISITNLIAQSTSDLQGDALGLVFVAGGLMTNNTVIATTTNGSSVYIANPYKGSAYIVLTPTNNLNETFAYVVSDTTYPTLTATNLITISVSNAVGQLTGSISTSGGGGITTMWAGIPASSYAVQRSTNMTIWADLWTTNAPVAGVFIYTDLNPPQPTAYYRLRQN